LPCAGKSNFTAVFTPEVDFPDHIQINNISPVGAEKGIAGQPCLDAVQAFIDKPGGACFPGDTNN